MLCVLSVTVTICNSVVCVIYDSKTQMHPLSGPCFARRKSHFAPICISSKRPNDHVSDGVGLTGFKIRAIVSCLFICSFRFPLFSIFHHSMCSQCVVGVFGPIDCSHFLVALQGRLFKFSINFFFNLYSVMFKYYSSRKYIEK